MNLLDAPPFGLSPEDFIVALAALAAVLTVVGLWLALVPREFGAARARAIVNHRMALKAAVLAPSRRRTLLSPDFMQTVVERLNLLRSRQADQVGRKLAQAGLRSKDAVIAYLFAKATLPLALGGAVAFLVFVAGLWELSAQMKAVVSIGGVLAGYLGPDIYIKNGAQKRQAKIRKALPDALDLMVICAEAGLSLDATMLRVSRELARPFPEIADEFGLTSVELGFMPERRRALDNLSMRTNLPPIRALVNALLQTDKFGTPLAQSLRVLSAELRNERMMRAEEKAARLPAIMTVPMIVFILPPLFIVLLGPAILRLIDQFINR